MKPIRIQLRRTKGWRLPANTVVVARPSKWGNPYRIGDDIPGRPGEKMDRGDVVMWHRIGIIKAPVAEIEAIRRDLRGKNLACWCALSAECHADTLLEAANDNLQPAPATKPESSAQAESPGGVAGVKPKARAVTK